jgi:hypothetical protein
MDIDSLHFFVCVVCWFVRPIWMDGWVDKHPPLLNLDQKQLIQLI